MSQRPANGEDAAKDHTLSNIPNMPRQDPDVDQTSTQPRLRFMDLPSEIHSQIATYLTLSEIIPFLSLNTALLALTRSHLSPFPSLIRASLDRGSPYPPILSKLPSLTLVQPDEDGTLFLDVLVRARPRWILERLELGRWTEAIWKEAFERRFLPSWKRYRLQGDSWRAVFLRILGRLEHRNMGCTHDESWTRFITLNRNGSASINRIYSRQFDPYQIYDELKHQNNFASEPTTVRVVVHLQDLRVIVLGVLYRHPSLFVNQNAHDLLHPPLLREFEEMAEPDLATVVSADTMRKAPASVGGDDIAGPSRKSQANGSGSGTAGTASASPSAANNEIYYPLVRSLSPSGPQNTTYGLSETSQPTPSGRRATFSSLLSPSLLKTRRPSSQNVNPPMAPYPTIPRPAAAPTPDSQSSKGRFAGARLTLTRSRESDDGSKSRKWNLGSGRRHSGEERRSGTVIPASALFSENPYGPGNVGNGDDGEGGGSSREQGGRIIRASALFSDYPPSSPISQPSSSIVPGPSILSNPIPIPTSASASGATSVLATPIEVNPPQPELVISANNHPAIPRPSASASMMMSRRQLPYAPMRKPQPAPSHRLYPNHTPSIPPVSSSADIDSDPNSNLFDRRPTHSVVEDDYAGNLWASRRGTDEDPDGQDGEGQEWSARERFVEWDEELGSRRRWVGPMLIMAQLHPQHHPRAQPPGVDPSSPTEGPDPDLGPKGMYASLGFEDLEAIMGWVELRGGGAYVSDPRRGGMGFEPDGT